MHLVIYSEIKSRPRGIKAATRSQNLLAVGSWALIGSSDHRFKIGGSFRCCPAQDMISKLLELHLTPLAVFRPWRVPIALNVAHTEL
jgi:hypothetical protein